MLLFNFPLEDVFLYLELYLFPWCIWKEKIAKEEDFNIGGGDKKSVIFPRYIRVSSTEPFGKSNLWSDLIYKLFSGFCLEDSQTFQKKHVFVNFQIAYFSVKVVGSSYAWIQFSQLFYYRWQYCKSQIADTRDFFRRHTPRNMPNGQLLDLFKRRKRKTNFTSKVPKVWKTFSSST